MAQAGYTPIQLYYSSTTTNAPTAGNLASGELAINITDGKLFYKDNGGSVQVIAWKTTPTTAGGTGLTSWTAGDLPYYATGTTLSKLGIGTNGQILTSTGTAPQWSTLSGVAVTTFSAGTTGFTPSSATSGAVTLAGTLATTNGGTGLTSFTANGVVYASSSSALTTGSALTFDGTNLGLSNSAAATVVKIDGSGRYKQFETYSSGTRQFYIGWDNTSQVANITNDNNYPILFSITGSEQMRLTSTGLGIGNSNPAYKLDVVGTGSIISATRSDTNRADIIVTNSGGTVSFGINNSTGSWLTDGLGYYGYILGPSSASYGLQFGVGASNTAAVTIAPSGNLGIGTSSPAYKLEVVAPAGDNIVSTFRSGDATAANNAGGGFRSISSATATSRIAQMWLDADGANLSGVDYFYIQKNGNSGNVDLVQYSNAAMTFTTNATERARITSGGDFRIGTVGSSDARLYVRGAGTTSATASFEASNSSGATRLYVQDDGTTRFFGLAGSETARITSGGDLLVGTTVSGGEKATFESATIGNANVGIVQIRSTKSADASDCLMSLVKQSNNNSTSQVFVRFGIDGYNSGNGQINGNGAGAAAFGAFSDARLKENIAALPPQLANVMALRPVEFDYIASEGGGHQIGFIAQEMQQVYPDVVGERADGMLTVTGWSKTEARLVKAIQEQQALITDLRARVAQLEAK